MKSVTWEFQLAFAQSYAISVLNAIAFKEVTVPFPLCFDAHFSAVFENRQIFEGCQSRVWTCSEASTLR